MFRRYPSMLLAVCLIAVKAQAQLPESVAAKLRAAKIPDNTFAAIILPVNGGAPRLEHRADAAVNPASTMKLVSTLAALETLWPTYTWKTAIYSDGVLDGETLKGNLYVRGSGDPKLTYERIWLLLRDLRSHGVRRVEGDLVLDRSEFKLSPEASNGNFDDQPERAYNVAPDALLMNFKALRFDIEADSSKATVRIDPPMAGVTATSHLKLGEGDCANWTHGWARPDISNHPDGKVVVTLQGKFPRNCHGSRYLGLFDPVEFADRLTRGIWAEVGGEITGKTREGGVPANAKLLVEQSSQPLGEILRDINKLSNNLMARSVFLTLGAEYAKTHPDAAALTSQQSAELSVQAWLRKHSASFPELVVDNGAGLSRIARISPRHLAQVLALGNSSAFAPEFAASLPIVGLDGTMRRRLIDSPVAGVARIKTGTLDDVKAVAGYVRDDKQQLWLLVGIINHPHAENGQPALDALIEWAATAPQ